MTTKQWGIIFQEMLRQRIDAERLLARALEAGEEEQAELVIKALEQNAISLDFIDKIMFTVATHTIAASVSLGLLPDELLNEKKADAEQSNPS